MERRRRLLTGPHGPTLRDRLIEEFPNRARGLWLVPSPLARDRLARDLARPGRGVSFATVWTWDDLWREVRARRGDGPILSPEPALRALLNEAIDLAAKKGRLLALGDSLAMPGFRRRVRHRIASWTRSGLNPDGTPPEGGDIAEAEWSIFASYRRLLGRLHLEDADGFARWAARTLHSDPPRDLARPRLLTVLEPRATGEVAIALDAFRGQAEAMDVSLAYDPEPSRRDAFAEAGGLRDRLLAWEFAEETVAPDPARPAGLASLTRDLFREGPGTPNSLADGLAILSAPEGDGESLVICRRLRELLGSGVSPDEVLVVLPRLDERAIPLLETLRDWGISTADARPVRMATFPAVSALRLAMRLPSEGWNADETVRLLRHGLVRPDWPELSSPLDLAAAATAIRETRAYRGVDAIRDGLRRAATISGEDDGEPRTKSRRRRAERASRAIPLVDRLIATIDASARAGPWSAQVDRLLRLASDLGLRDAPGLEALALALDDHGEALARLGRGPEVWSWSGFTAEVSALILDLDAPPCLPRSGCVRVASAAEVEGADTAHLILAGLIEGTFPARSALEGDAGEEPEVRERAYGREMARFLHLVNLPRESLTLAFPSTDEKGQELLSAGFLDDVRRVFTDLASRRITHDIAHLDPVLPAEYAVAPAEGRIYAVARACLAGEFAGLDSLSRRMAHRGPLEGTARALKLSHWRNRRARFGRFDGRLSDPRIAEKLALDFGPDSRPFSASQLESLSLCPFQFHQRYILGLEPVEDRRELEEDRTSRGSLLHRALETLHARLRDIPPEDDASLADRVAGGIEATFDAVLAAEREPSSEIQRGLLDIESERMRRAARRYARQFRAYADDWGKGASCRQFEVGFGGTRDAFAALSLGRPPRLIRVSGVIDRIDMIGHGGRSLFRVIDYKSGAAPAKGELASGLALQLPLYAMAAERVIFVEESAEPLDAAYWGLKDRGFQPARAMTAIEGDRAGVEAAWNGFARDLEEFLLALVDRLRDGDFPVHPRKADCERFCDYRFLCRITPSRRGVKSWPESPVLESRP